ncbi:M36 family metallopeptidase [Flavitalea flava]
MRILYTFCKGAIIFLGVFLFLMLPAKAQTQQTQETPAQLPGDTAAARQKAMNLLHKNLQVSGLNQATLDSYEVTDSYFDKKSGTFLVYLQQAYLGVPVYNVIGVYIFRNDSLIGKKADFIPRIATRVEARSVAGGNSGVSITGASGAGGGPGPRVTFAVNAVQAIRFAAGHLHIPFIQEPRMIQKDDVRQRFVYRSTGISKRNIGSDLVWLPVNEGKQVRLSWNVRIVSPDGNGDWLVRIDAQTGEVLGKSSLVVSERAGGECVDAPGNEAAIMGMGTGTKGDENLGKGEGNVPPAPPAVSSASYRVYPFPLESANYGPRALDLNPWLKAGAGNDAISIGWHFDNTTNFDYTRGNNVWAQQDIDGTSNTTGFADTSITNSPGLTFDRNIDPSASPTTYSNIRAAMDNLFYWNNIMHDISYQYGFDEAAGNFQESNQGRGGLGGDYVNAFAEDGASINNSDFSTPPDGENPKMRMFQWNTATGSAFHVNSPSPLVADYQVSVGSISIQSQLTTTGPVTADIVLANDIAASTHQGCAVGGFSNAASLVDRIVLIDRGGGCSLVAKIKAAQNAGAIAVIIVNNVTGAPTAIGAKPADTTIRIPSVMISLTDGTTLKNNLTGLNGTLSAVGVNRDGSLDNGVIAHEYTHGISNRLTGGPSHTDCLNDLEQMGEGWSDYLALMVTTNWSTATASDGPRPRPIGTYVFNQTTAQKGIRTYPYSTDLTVNPWNYSNLAGIANSEPHTVGEIWCGAIWDMTWNIIQQEGIDPDIYHGNKGNNIALQLVIEGMKYQPCDPGFLDGRDAILKADSILYNYAHKCAIWNAFSRRGMGKSAKQGSVNSTTDQTAATDLPQGLGIVQTVDKTNLVQGDHITYTIKAYCDCTPLSGVRIVDTLSRNLTYVSSPGGSYTAPYVHFDGLNFAAGEVRTFTVQASVAGSYTAQNILINDTRDPASYSWTPAVTNGSTNFVASTARSHSPANSWFAADKSTTTDFTLTSGDLLLDSISTLSFWHWYETDATWDGGVVELSTNGGSSWQDLGSYMAQNGYNNTIDPSNNGIGSRKAFSGSSGGGFVQTIIPLTGFAGMIGRIRFRFASDNVASDDPSRDEGWYIDDISLRTEKGAISLTSAFTSTGTLLSGSNTISTFSSVPLPVHFLSFDARNQNKTALLHWTVNGELHVDKYVIERSADGMNFTAIGEVSGNPSGAAAADYFFPDNQPLEGKNFYRIVEKDIDGKSTISVTKLLQFTASGMLIRLSPVPTYNHLVQMEIETSGDQTLSACLINTMGATIKVYRVKKGMNQLNLENFSKGIYFLRIQTSDKNSEIRKIVIQ